MTSLPAEKPHRSSYTSFNTPPTFLGLQTANFPLHSATMSPPSPSLGGVPLKPVLKTDDDRTSPSSGSVKGEQGKPWYLSGLL